MIKKYFEAYVCAKNDYIKLKKAQTHHDTIILPHNLHRCHQYCNCDNVLLDDNMDNYLDYQNNMNGGATKGKKWKTLKHNGVMFHPPYEPHNVPISYNDEEIHLNPEAEEFITYFVNPRFDKYKNKNFETNFFKDWKKLLKFDLQKKIKDFSFVDLSKIKQHVLNEIESKKNNQTKISVIDKKKKEEEVNKYKVAIVDGNEQNIDNYIVEPPTIFIGRGNHPLSGSIKFRLKPEDITLNIGPNMDIPYAIIGNTKTNVWGDVISDPTLEWIASWQNNVTGKYNYARFGRKSSFKMKSDEEKYDLARKLKKKIKKIRDKNDLLMKSSDLEYRQLATALFLIDRLALRIGNEKRDDEADTVGVTTIKNSNLTLLADNNIKLDFLGKDSIRYVNKFVVPDQVYKNLKEFTTDKNKTNKSDVFDLVTADSLNKYIRSFMKKLTSKVFRTYNASHMMQIELKKITNKFKDDLSNRDDSSEIKSKNYSDKLQKLKHLYDMANLKVAKLCNHQKTTTSSGTQQLNKINDQINKIKTTISKLQCEKRKKQKEGKKVSHLNKKIALQQKKIKMYTNKKKLSIESKSLSAGTSKINYIDPRITIAFLKANNIYDSIDKFFNKSQQSQFAWAMNVDEKFTF